MKKATTHARKVGTHVLVTGLLAQVLERDTISGFHMLLVEYHTNRQPEQSNVEWIYANRAYPVL